MIDILKKEDVKTLEEVLYHYKVTMSEKNLLKNKEIQERIMYAERAIENLKSIYKNQNKYLTV